MNQEAGKQPSSPVPKSQLTTVVDLVARHLRDTVLSRNLNPLFDKVFCDFISGPFHHSQS